MKINKFRGAMNDEVRYCGISIKKLQDLANTYRKRYDSHYSKITPHITLKEAFEADETEINKISETVASIAKNMLH